MYCIYSTYYLTGTLQAPYQYVLYSKITYTVQLYLESLYLL